LEVNIIVKKILKFQRYRQFLLNTIILKRKA